MIMRWLKGYCKMYSLLEIAKNTSISCLLYAMYPLSDSSKCFPKTVFAKMLHHVPILPRGMQTTGSLLSNEAREGGLQGWTFFGAIWSFYCYPSSPSRRDFPRAFSQFCWRMSTDEGLHHQLSSDQNVPNVVYGSSWSGAGAGDGILMLACIWRQSVIQFTMARYSRPH